jgi:uncharacterized protein YdeI (YjbR/CyaY-like superfamily)
VTELMIRLFRVHASHRGIGYKEALDEALCFGWIDGVRRAFDEDSFVQRFTPRKAVSIWSKVNLGHVKRLEAAGRMHAAGRAALARRTEERTGVYSFEKRPQAFPPELRAKLDADVKAARFFDAQPPWLQRVTIHYISSAKREETRQRRFEFLIACGRKGQWLPPFDVIANRTKKTGGTARSGRAAKASGSGDRPSPTRRSRPRSRS